MTKPQCPHCGFDTDAEDLFCAGCGQEIPPPSALETLCQSCGQPRDPEDLFCAGCGGELPEFPMGKAEASAGGAPGRDTAPEVSRKPKKPTPKKPASKKPAPRKPPKAKTGKPKKAPAKKAKKPRTKGPASPKPQPVAGTMAPGTKKISRWWPESSGGRTAHVAILIAAGLFGLAAGEGDPASPPIAIALAHVLITFWRNVWISWTGGTTRQVDGPESNLPAPSQSPPAPKAGAEDIEPSGEGGGGTLEKVIGIAIVIGFIALVRTFAPQILKVLF